MERGQPAPFLERVSSTPAGDWWLRGLALVSWTVLLVCVWLLPGAWSRAQVFAQDGSCARTVGQPPIPGACALLPGRMTGAVKEPGRSSNGWELRYVLSDGLEQRVPVPGEFVNAVRERHGRMAVRTYKGQAVQYLTGDVISPWGHGPEWGLFLVELPLGFSLFFASLFSIPAVYRLRHPRPADRS